MTEGTGGMGESGETLNDSASSSRFLADAFYRISGASCRLFAVIITARLLGSERFGQLGIVIKTVEMVSTVGALSLPPAATRYLAFFRVADRERVRRVAIFAAVAAFASALLFSCALLLAARPFAESVIARPNLVAPLRLASALIMFRILEEIAKGALAGFKDFKLIGLVDALASFLMVPLVVFCVRAWGTSGAVIASAIISLAGATGCAIPVLRRLARGDYAQTTARWTTETGLLWEFSLPNTIGVLLTKLAPWVGITMLARLPGGEAHVGLFYAVDRVTEASLFFLMLAASTALPVMAERVAARDADGLGRLALLNIWLAWMMTMPAAVFATASEPLIMRVLGPDFSGRGPILSIVVLAVVAASHTVVLFHVLLAHAKAWALAGFAAVWASVVVVVSWRFAPSLGAVGVAVSITAAYVATGAMAWGFGARVCPILRPRLSHVADIAVFLDLYGLACVASGNLSPFAASLCGVILSILCAGVIWVSATDEQRRVLSGFLRRKAASAD